MTKSRDAEDKKHPAHDPSRRKFLKGVGFVGAGAAIADHLWVEAEAEEKAATPESLSGTIKVLLDVNGQSREAQVEPRTTLLNTLRNHLDPAVTGPKLVCDVGTCGACTVLLDGKPVYSCLVLAVDATRKKITTVEGLGTPENPNAVQAAFVENDALMCGFCTPGFVTTISAYLKKNPNPSLAEVREACKGNFFSCGTIREFSKQPSRPRKFAGLRSRRKELIQQQPQASPSPSPKPKKKICVPRVVKRRRSKWRNRVDADVAQAGDRTTSTPYSTSYDARRWSVEAGIARYTYDQRCPGMFTAQPALSARSCSGHQDRHDAAAKIPGAHHSRALDELRFAGLRSQPLQLQHLKRRRCTAANNVHYDCSACCPR